MADPGGEAPPRLLYIYNPMIYIYIYIYIYTGGSRGRGGAARPPRPSLGSARYYHKGGIFGHSGGKLPTQTGAICRRRDQYAALVSDNNAALVINMLVRRPCEVRLVNDGRAAKSV